MHFVKFGNTIIDLDEIIYVKKESEVLSIKMRGAQDNLELSYKGKSDLVLYDFEKLSNMLADRTLAKKPLGNQ
jgi:predicted nucleotidyltransferase